MYRRRREEERSRDLSRVLLLFFFLSLSLALFFWSSAREDINAVCCARSIHLYTIYKSETTFYYHKFRNAVSLSCNAINWTASLRKKNAAAHERVGIGDDAANGQIELRLIRCGRATYGAKMTRGLEFFFRGERRTDGGVFMPRACALNQLFVIFLRFMMH